MTRIQAPASRTSSRTAAITFIVAAVLTAVAAANIVVPLSGQSYFALPTGVPVLLSDVALVIGALSLLRQSRATALPARFDRARFSSFAVFAGATLVGDVLNAVIISGAQSVLMTWGLIAVFLKDLGTVALVIAAVLFVLQKTSRLFERIALLPLAAFQLILFATSNAVDLRPPAVNAVRTVSLLFAGLALIVGTRARVRS